MTEPRSKRSPVPQSTDIAQAASAWLTEYIAEAPVGVDLPSDLYIPKSDVAVTSYLRVVVVRADVVPAMVSDCRHEVLTWLTAFIVLLSRYGGGVEVCVAVDDQRLASQPLVLRSTYDTEEKPYEFLDRIERELRSIAKRIDPLSDQHLRTLLLPCQAAIVQEERPLSSQVCIALRVLKDAREAWLELDSAMFTQEAADRVATHLKAIREAFNTSPSLSVGAIPWLTPDERRCLLENFSGRACQAPPIGLVHRLFEEQTERTPNSVALVAADRSMTFAELQGEAYHLAQLLVNHGVGPEVRVGVCLQRTSVLVVALLAVLMAGGCYVPLDPNYPDERIAYMLSDSDCSLVLVNQQTEAKILGFGQPTLLVPGTFPEEQIHPLVAGVTPSNLAYIIYTSGSTGRPKGIAIEHRSVYAFLCWSRDVFNYEERSGILAATSICFDLSIFEIFTPLSWGGTVHLVADILALADYPRREEIRLVNTTPSAMAALLSLGSLPRSVITINLAGEAFPSYLAQALWTCAHVRRVLNLYGPSEDTTYSTWAELSPDDTANPSIGHPLPGTTVYVLDSHGEPVPIGVPGELYLGGAGLARGYFGKAEQTAERFVPNPFDAQLNVRLYRTGDRVRFRSDGTLEHLGRLDEQVKIRGFRIELGEITSALAEFSSVEEAITVVREAPDGNQQLVVYYVATDTVDQASLVAWLAKRLPHYMVPSAFVQLNALPKTLNGKIEKKRLPDSNAVSALRATTGTVAQAPVAQDPVGRAVIEAWVNVLGHPPESSKTFFAAGGNSLQAVQLVARVQNRLGLTISLAKFVEQPTVQGLIDLVRNASALPKYVSSPSESHKRDEEGAALTFAERRLWVQQQLEPSDTSYLLTARLRLEGDVEIARLVDALQTLLTRHEALRRCIALEGGLPRPVILPSESVPIAVEPPVEPSAVEPSLVALAQCDGSCPFDLAHEAPTRIRILPVGSGMIEILITVHHVSFDDWSLGLLAEDLVAAYEDRLSQPPTLSLADIAAMEQASSAMQEKRAAVHRWVKLVGDMPLDLQLGDVRPRPTNRSGAGTVYEAELSVDARRAVAALARRLETTEFAVIMAAFQSLLWFETGAERFLVGTALAGRHQVEAERIVGCFVNMLLLPADVQPHFPFESFVTDVSRRLFDLIAHQDIPVERWLEALRENRWVDGRSLVRVACGAHNARHRIPICGERLTASARFLPPTTARLDLTLWIEEREKKLYALWTYATDLFTRGDVVRRHLRFDALLSHVNKTDGALIKDVVAVLNAKPPEKSDIGIRTMTFSSGQRSFERRISLKAKRSSDFVRVEKNWLNGNLPVLIEAQVSGLPLADWITSRRDVLREDIVRHGGILFRGFSMQGAADFAAAARAFASDLLDYKEQSSPRTPISEQIYTSTDHPADQPIFLHNEQSYTVDWPLFILFFCLSEPSHGGRTPIADNRCILTRLPDKVLDRFANRGILYVRNYIPGISLFWQDAFQTDDKREVEAFCEQNQIRFCWVTDDHLRTWQRRSAFQLHPITGDRLWFNHALFFHATSLLPKVRDALLKVLPEEDLPYNTYYGDGSPIEHDTLEALRVAIDQETIRFDWHRGDLLILDNMLTQHGREPYEGSRRILTAMATLYSSLACPLVPETPNDCIARTTR